MTFTPYGFTSGLSDLEKPSIANFEAQYKVLTGTPISPETERILTICPLF